ncbi:MAG TPA: hypothetical protein VHG91_04085 [Longimicrobium sp.]|nr:hypothetical protein [Longimicrobium sp.]
MVTYRTQPDIPWDVVDATKMWFMAAILVQCYSMVIGGEPFLIVQEIAKYGYIEDGGLSTG